MTGEKDIRVLGIGGSMRRGSRSELAALAALEGARDAGALVSMWPVDEETLPFYEPGGPLSPEAERFLKSVRDADAYVWSTPAYHGSVSAPVKNLLDYIDAFGRDMPPFLAGKVVGVTAVGDGSIAPVQATAVLVQIAHALQAVVVPMQVPVCYAANAISDDRIIDQGVKTRLAELGRLLVATTARLRRTMPGGGRDYR